MMRRDVALITVVVPADEGPNTSGTSADRAAVVSIVVRRDAAARRVAAKLRPRRARLRIRAADRAVRAPTPKTERLVPRIITPSRSRETVRAHEIDPTRDTEAPREGKYCI